MKASRLAGEEFLGRLNYYGRSWLPARDLVLDALSRRTNVDPSGRIVVFDLYAPWKVRSKTLVAMAQKGSPFKTGAPVRAGARAGGAVARATLLCHLSRRDRR